MQELFFSSAFYTLKLLMHAHLLTERSPMFDKLGWLTVNQLIFYHTVIAVFKIRSSKEPEHLDIILSNDSRNSRLIIPNLNLKITQKSFT